VVGGAVGKNRARCCKPISQKGEMFIFFPELGRGGESGRRRARGWKGVAGEGWPPYLEEGARGGGGGSAGGGGEAVREQCRAGGAGQPVCSDRQRGGGASATARLALARARNRLGARAAGGFGSTTRHKLVSLFIGCSKSCQDMHPGWWLCYYVVSIGLVHGPMVHNFNQKKKVFPFYFI